MRLLAPSRSSSGSSIADRVAARLSRVTSGGVVLPEIDGLRFLPILLVILHHVVATYLQEARPLGPIQLPQDWARAGEASPWIALASHANFGVQLFFVISGFALSLPFLRTVIDGASSPNLKRYFLRRLIRLEPPYAVALLISFGLLLSQGKPVALFAEHLLASMLYLHGPIYGSPSWILGIAWSLEIEAQFYLAMPLLASLLFTAGRRARQSRIAVLTLLSGLASQLFLDTPLAPPAINLSLLNALPYFTAGFLLADLYLERWRRGPSRYPVYWDLAGLGAGALAVALLVWPVHIPRLPWWFQRPWNGRGFAFLLPWLALVSYAAVFRGRLLHWVATRRWLVIGGGMCYTAYLYHSFVIQFLFWPVFAPIRGRFGIGAEILALFLGLLVPVFLATAVLFVSVERPFMGVRYADPQLGANERGTAQMACARLLAGYGCRNVPAFHRSFAADPGER